MSLISGRNGVRTRHSTSQGVWALAGNSSLMSRPVRRLPLLAPSQNNMSPRLFASGRLWGGICLESLLLLSLLLLAGIPTIGLFVRL